MIYTPTTRRGPLFRNVASQLAASSDSVIRALGRAEGFAAIYQPAAQQPAHPELAELCLLNAPQGFFYFFFLLAKPITTPCNYVCA